jgi:hypothetical protein
MPVIDVVHQHFITARALHTAQRVRGDTVQFETLDYTAVVAAARVAAGLDGFDCKVRRCIICYFQSLIPVHSTQVT